MEETTGEQKKTRPRKDKAKIINFSPEIVDSDGKLVPLKIARLLAETMHLISVADTIHMYRSGAYRPVNDCEVEIEAIKLIQDASRRSILADILHLIRVHSFVPIDLVNTATRTLNLQNTLLSLDDGPRQHSLHFLSTIQIPIDYDEHAACPTWLRCLEDWLPGQPEIHDLLQEYVGYCLIASTAYCKALLLVGGGSNGKSVFLEVLNMIFGQVLSAVPLGNLGQMNSAAELFGKLVNVCSELDIDSFDEGLFKAVVSGDVIQAERKYKDPFKFKPCARWVISTNNLPHVSDKSDGFFRRLLIVRFAVKFEEPDQDINLQEKLRLELPGILNWALIGLGRLESRARFAVPAAVSAEIAVYREHSNPLASWVNDCCRLSPYVSCTFADLFSNYREWCLKFGYRSMAANKFSMEFTRHTNLTFRRSSNPESRQRIADGVNLHVE